MTAAPSVGSSVALSIGGLVASILGLGVYGLATLAKKDRSMTALEKAFNTLVILLCQRANETDETNEKLRKELADRPTREQLEAEQKRGLHLNDELNGLRRKNEELTKSRDELATQLDRALKGDRKTTRRRRPEARPA